MGCSDSTSLDELVNYSNQLRNWYSGAHMIIDPVKRTDLMNYANVSLGNFGMFTFLSITDLKMY